MAKRRELVPFTSLLSVFSAVAVGCASACAGGSIGGQLDRDDAGVTTARDASTTPNADASTTPGEDASTTPGEDAGTTPANDAGTTPRPDAGATTGAWRPFSADSPWNTPIPANPTIDPDSARLIEAFATSSQWAWLDVSIAQFSVPIYWVDDSTPRVRVQVNRVAGEGFHDDPMVPIPAGAMQAAGTDAHLAIIHRGTGREWDFWRAANNNGQWTCEVCAAIDTHGRGVRPYPQQSLPGTWYLAHGSRACGFPLSAGLITVDEIRAGRIEHALVIGYPGIRSRYFKDPASTAQATTPRISPDFGVPCGGRIQLDPSIDVTTLGLSNSGQIIARALQEYGAFVGDFNGSIALYADASPDAMAAWGSGLLQSGVLRNRVDLRSFRVLEIGQLYNDGN